MRHKAFTVLASFRNCDSGIWASLGSSLMWGALPLYWYLLRDVSPFYILCHRVVWACLFLLPLVILTRRMGEVVKAARDAKTLRALFCSSLVLAFNWGLYIWAVNNGRVIEASLGYFISPLITICMGVVLFRDRPSPMRWVAIVIAFAGILAEIGINGNVPWAGLCQSVSFSTYALLRKVGRVESLPGLMLETAILFPFSVVFIAWCHYYAVPGTGAIGLTDILLLMGAGVVTSTPLILYAYGARRLPFMTLGILQYVSPLLSALIGVFVFREPLTAGRIASLSAIWLALVLYTADTIRNNAHARVEKTVISRRSR
ncbi:MAG: EamA family transporter RarD [Deltaproteobacteria bacterium]|nr:EamA family transporter RarD [Deltaproteobacteria bacterium]